MPHFRILYLDTAGRVALFQDLSCDTADQAQDTATRLSSPGVEFEVWQGSKIVAFAEKKPRA